MSEEVDRLRHQASACRRIARAHHDEHVIAHYEELARQYDDLAIALEAAEQNKGVGTAGLA